MEGWGKGKPRVKGIPGERNSPRKGREARKQRVPEPVGARVESVREN